jgi:hypothetical protein
MLRKRSTAQTAWTMPAKRRTTSLLRVPDEPVVGHDNQVALTQAERRKAVDLIQKLLGMVDDGHLAVDGPAGVALVRRLEGAMLALRAMDDPRVKTDH